MAVAAMAAVFSSCTSTVQCEPESFLEAVLASEEVGAFIYDNNSDTVKLPDGEELAALMQGSWEKRDGRPDGEKVLSVTADMQYEVCFFDDGTAMIYYGYCGVFEKDRLYYNVTLDTGLDPLVEYVKENGVVIEDDAEAKSE